MGASASPPRGMIPSRRRHGTTVGLSVGAQVAASASVRRRAEQGIADQTYFVSYLRC